MPRPPVGGVLKAKWYKRAFEIAWVLLATTACTVYLPYSFRDSRAMYDSGSIDRTYYLQRIYITQGAVIAMWGFIVWQIAAAIREYREQ